jgi:hypothetical protein
VKKFNIGDKVVVPFLTACLECYYCVCGQASRCAKGELYGNSMPRKHHRWWTSRIRPPPIGRHHLYQDTRGDPERNASPNGGYFPDRLLRRATLPQESQLARQGRVHRRGRWRWTSRNLCHYLRLDYGQDSLCDVWLKRRKLAPESSI